MGNDKSLCISYLLWLTLGWTGLHHFYLRRDRQAFVWWSTLGGFFFLGWFRDLWRLPEYVDDANEDSSHMFILSEKMRKKSYPRFNIVRFAGELSVGFFYGFLVRMAFPVETPALIVGIGVCIGITIGVHLVGNIGREKGEFAIPFVATLVTYTLLAFLMEDENGGAKDPNYMYCSLAASFAFNHIKQHRRSYKHSSLKKRVLTFSFCMFLITSLWVSFLYFNAEITTDDGEKIKLRDSVHHFFTSPAWLEFTETMKQIYDEAQKNGWRNVYDEFVKALDPKGVSNAYKVLGVKENASEQEVKRSYKKLVREWHPDRHKDPKKKAEAQQKFMEIQTAYEILTSKKSSNTRTGSERTEF